MIESLEHIDHQLLLFINGCHHPWADLLMTAFSGNLIWIPLYFWCLVMLIKEKQHRVWLSLFFLILLISISDQTSVHLFKNTFQRYRPCHNLELKESLHLLEGACKGKYGFVSSHAVNSFATATFLSLIVRKRGFYLMFFWAFIVSYSRIYLGVHFPSDVVAGALLGIILAFAIFYFYQRTETSLIKISKKKQNKS